MTHPLKKNDVMDPTRAVSIDDSKWIVGPVGRFLHICTCVGEILGMYLCFGDGSKLGTEGQVEHLLLL
jgi:hypothetical protein